MLLTRQKARCFWILSMLWQCCLLVVRRYFCRERAIEGNMARAASRTSIMSEGVARSSSFFIRRTWVKASSTATTSLTERQCKHSSELTHILLNLNWSIIQQYLKQHVCNIGVPYSCIQIQQGCFGLSYNSYCIRKGFLKHISMLFPLINDNCEYEGCLSCFLLRHRRIDLSILA